MLLAVGLSGWSLSYALNTAATELWLKNIFFISGTSFVCLTFFATLPMTLTIVGRTARFPRWVLVLFGLVPLLSFMIVLTNDLHGLMRHNLYLVRSGDLLLLGFSEGWYFPFHIIYVYLYFLLVMVLSLAGILRRSQSRRGSLALIFAATLVPLATDILKMSPIKGLQLTTSALFVSGICYWLAVFRFQLLNLVPLARATLFEQMHEPVLVIDNNGCLAEKNRSADSLLNLTGSAVGQPLDLLFPSGHMLHGLLTPGEVLTRHDAATGCWWHLSLTPLRHDGINVGYLAVLHDVTEMTQAKENIRAALALEQKARTEQDQFLTMLSHEYHTPLAIIQANLDLLELQEQRAEKPHASRIVSMKQAISRLVEVMGSALDRTRLDGQHAATDDEPVNLTELLDGVIDRAEGFWSDRLFMFTPGEPTTTIRGNRAQLVTALLNLLDNACKYSPDTTPVLIECREEEGLTTISVTNQGLPLLDRELGHVFEKFWRGGNSQGTSGAGLGLWLVRSIVEQHGGTVSLSSRPGSSTAVALTLPMMA